MKTLRATVIHYRREGDKFVVKSKSPHMFFIGPGDMVWSFEREDERPEAKSALRHAGSTYYLEEPFCAVCQRLEHSK